MPITVTTRDANRRVQFGSTLPIHSPVSRITEDPSEFSFLETGEISECVPSEAPPLLYHYTDPFGLEGIAKSGELWANPASTLNDETEMRVFSSEVRSELDRKRASLIQDGKFSKREEQVFKRLELFVRSAGQEAYVLSLTEKGDQLSQWRAYAGNGAGYSIGIPTVALLQSAKDQDFTMVRCSYKRATMNPLARKLVEVFVRSVPDDELPDKATPHPVLSAMRELVTILSPCFKHDGFEEEKEWRIFRRSNEYEPHVRTRATNDGVINFIALSWRQRAVEEQGRPKGEKVTVISGPGTRDSSGVHRIFRHDGLTVGLGTSQIPYLG